MVWTAHPRGDQNFNVGKADSGRSLKGKNLSGGDYKGGERKLRMLPLFKTSNVESRPGKRNRRVVRGGGGEYKFWKLRHDGKDGKRRKLEAHVKWELRLDLSWGEFSPNYLGT